MKHPRAVLAALFFALAVAAGLGVASRLSRTSTSPQDSPAVEYVVFESHTPLIPSSTVRAAEKKLGADDAPKLLRLIVGESAVFVSAEKLSSPAEGAVKSFRFVYETVTGPDDLVKKYREYFRGMGLEFTEKKTELIHEFTANAPGFLNVVLSIKPSSGGASVEMLYDDFRPLPSEENALRSAFLSALSWLEPLIPGKLVEAHTNSGSSNPYVWCNMSLAGPTPIATGVNGTAGCSNFNCDSSDHSPGVNSEIGVEWGDGNWSWGPSLPNWGGSSIGTNHTYTSNGTYSIKVHCYHDIYNDSGYTDAHNFTVSASFTASGICNCGSWSDTGNCNNENGADCPTGQKEQTRSCNPDGCQGEKRCVASSACPQCVCGSWANQACGGGTCASNQRYQTRNCTGPDCSGNATSQCVADSTCCSCGSWTDQSCGPTGGCAATQMYQTRNCSPNACLSESRCQSNSACGGTTPVCGNGVVESGETCDLGASNGACPSACSTSCTANTCSGAFCGNGVVESGETCDLGSENGICPRLCSGSCAVNACVLTVTLTATPDSGALPLNTILEAVLP